jgi:hypothetical protein
MLTLLKFVPGKSFVVRPMGTSLTVYRRYSGGKIFCISQQEFDAARGSTTLSRMDDPYHPRLLVGGINRHTESVVAIDVGFRTIRSVWDMGEWPSKESRYSLRFDCTSRPVPVAGRSHLCRSYTHTEVTMVADAVTASDDRLFEANKPDLMLAVDSYRAAMQKLRDNNDPLPVDFVRREFGSFMKCPDCKGSGQYVGLTSISPCKRCCGSKTL